MSISEKLKQCDSVASVKNFTEQLTYKIGIFGGRRFYGSSGKSVLKNG